MPMNRTDSHQTILFVTMSISFVFLLFSFSLFYGEKCSTSTTLPDGFVYLNEFLSDFQLSLRYASDENFVGHRINGYLANISIVSEAAAIGLKRAQQFAKDIGYELVIYDGYRPQKSVDQFIFWSEDSTDPQRKKSFYYPRVNKEEAFNLGYIARKSGHTRGSTIDLTLISLGKSLQRDIIAKERRLNDNSTIFFLDDGTIDMGSSFDLFDEASHTTTSLISSFHQNNRYLLRDLMNRSGFTNYENEWWHFTLRNEPFPDQYFDFDISLDSSSLIC